MPTSPHDGGNGGTESAEARTSIIGTLDEPLSFQQLEPAFMNIRKAVALHQAGRLAEAQAAYKAFLKRAPMNAEAWYFLGLTHAQLNQPLDAVKCIEKALAIAPDNAEAQFNLGSVLVGLNRHADAARCFERVVALEPDNLEARNDLGCTLAMLNRPEEAIPHFERVVAAKSRDASVCQNLGTALSAANRHQDAIEYFERVIAIQPMDATAHDCLGSALAYVHRYQEAMRHFESAISIRPDFAQAHFNLGTLLSKLKQRTDAIRHFERAIALNPGYAESHYNLGNALAALNRYAEAVRCLECAIAIKPDHAEANNALGTALAALNRHTEAVRHFERALAIKPDFAEAHSNKIFALDFFEDMGFAEHQAARRQWNDAHAKDLPRARLAQPDGTDPSRRLVIGYVSADFRKHSAAACFGPVMRHHDKTRFEVVCYSGVQVEDELTQELRRHADRWRPVTGLPDDALAEQIVTDKVDILVDLSGHSEGNRLLVFARKPAPIQVTAWGHASGTGLPAIDYLLSDAVAVPADVRALFAETIVDLPCLITFESPADAPPVMALPAQSRGFITFGCLNRFSKVSQRALELWAQILHAVPKSRLLLKDIALSDPLNQSLARDILGKHGIAAERIELRGGSSHPDHLAAYGDVDIALDPFPHSGGVSTWESLWMGVPVVAKLGNSLTGRLAGSILCSVGLGEWVAHSDAQYVALATEKAANTEALARFRREARACITATPAGNSALYTRAVEDAYGTMWRRC